MGIVVVIVCLGAGLNLALWAVLWRKVDDLPAAFLALARRERAEGEARALAALQELAAGRVTSITLSLQSLEEQQIERNREERAAAEMRARVAERRALDAMPLLGTATDLLREARALVEALHEQLSAAEERRGGRPTPLPEHTASGPRLVAHPPASEAATEGGEGGTP